MNKSQYLQDLINLKNSLEESREISEKMFGPSELSPTTDSINTIIQDLRKDIKDLADYEYGLMIAEDKENYK